MRRAEATTDLLQVVKAVIATTGAWWVCVTFLDSQMPFLAPWVALMTIQATVSSSIVRGTQTMIASFIGVLMSFMIGVYLGVDIWTYALAILVGMLGAQIPGLRQEGISIATTAIFLLSAGFTEDTPALIDRMIEIGIGVAMGIGVNIVVIPPLRDKQAAQTVDNLNRRMGEVMHQMGEEFADSWNTDQAHEWSEKISQMRHDLDQTWRAVQFARDSRRRNPRQLLHRGATEGYEDVLFRLDESIAHLRNLARTVETASYSESAWDTNFREQWAVVLRDTARRITQPDADVEPIVDRLDQLARGMATEDHLPETGWPVYGALITSLRNVALLIEDVASDRENRDA